MTADEKTMLLDSMRWYDYSPEQILDAKSHPEEWAEELAQAIADLTGRDQVES